MTIDLSNIVKVSQTECPCCGSTTDIVMDMPNYPVTELFRPASDESDPYGFIDQKGRYCSNCGHFSCRIYLILMSYTVIQIT